MGVCRANLCLDALNLPAVIEEKLQPVCIPCAAHLSDGVGDGEFGGLEGGRQRGMDPRAVARFKEMAVEAKKDRGEA